MSSYSFLFILKHIKEILRRLCLEFFCFRQYDARTSTALSLIVFPGKECKSLAINETRPEMIAVALNEAAVPIYDRRNLSKPLLELIPGDFFPFHSFYSCDYSTKNVSMSRIFFITFL